MESMISMSNLKPFYYSFFKFPASTPSLISLLQFATAPANWWYHDDLTRCRQSTSILSSELLDNT